MKSKKRIEDFTVVRNTRLNSRHFLLELQPQMKLPELFPGQFVQVLVEGSSTTFLRRPFSIHSVDYKINTFSLLIQVKGDGTGKLSHIREGEHLNLIYPLGNFFSVPQGKEILLVGGGCGVAPLLFLAQFYSERSFKVTILTGWRTALDIFRMEEYQRFGNTLVITEDGSAGETGLVTDHSVFSGKLEQFSQICCCGPEAMMRAVAKIAKENNIMCEVSLENTMACGFGACLCCITPTRHGNQRVCMEGPVFGTSGLDW